MSKTTATEDLINPIWKNNPVFVQLLGLCPTLAVTNTLANGIAMGLATFFVLVGSSFFVAAARKFIPNEVRISAYIIIIATFVTIVDYVLNATVPTIHKALGAFIALIVVNCIILGRAEAFASKNTTWRATLDAIGSGAGFIVVMLMMSGFRELIGNGTLLGYPLLRLREPLVRAACLYGAPLLLLLLVLGQMWLPKRITGWRPLRHAQL